MPPCLTPFETVKKLDVDWYNIRYDVICVVTVMK